MRGHPPPDPVGPGQESVWAYPRPPALVESDEVVEIWVGGEQVARTDRSWRVLETSHPPTYYVPAEAFASGVLREAAGSSFCEWKGVASYFDLLTPARTAERAAWTYLQPTAGFAAITGAIAVMPSAVDRCVVDGETVRPQEGGFYGGWVTDRVVGPFKGGPGSTWW